MLLLCSALLGCAAAQPGCGLVHFLSLFLSCWRSHPKIDLFFLSATHGIRSNFQISFVYLFQMDKSHNALQWTFSSSKLWLQKKLPGSSQQTTRYIPTRRQSGCLDCLPGSYLHTRIVWTSILSRKWISSSFVQWDLYKRMHQLQAKLPENNKKQNGLRFTGGKATFPFFQTVGVREMEIHVQ